jgi:hypothetical protein
MSEEEEEEEGCVYATQIKIARFEVFIEMSIHVVLKVVMRNVILSHRFTASQPRRPRF